jgi:hypothetical protein
VIAALEPWQIGAIVGGIGGGLTVLLLALLPPARKCPECGLQLPKVRAPGSFRQVMWGGWTCPECGCEVDRKGKKVESKG